ncbi:hypothetical protein JAAARDRAFT_312892 [Jaapia argillacea MUCL 33604]|uniref:F-box domain-containing protein n=1 Tax=Jaapia argillacea MUCL 33604 TaxID=933084 RepID=A0A067PNY8_9AGAM|nr:hypothetical protein JAAARDRAFT_312892 [Jaapia argillacea MUCL 33604]
MASPVGSDEVVADQISVSTTLSPGTISAIQRCPVELWSRIFEIISADGRLGTNLPLVCRFFREVSDTIRLRAVRATFDVSNRTKIRSLFQMLCSRQAHRRNVQHTFLHICNSRSRAPLTSPAATLNTFLTMVSHSLTTLTLFMSPNTIIPRMHEIPLPYLRELTLHISQPQKKAEVGRELLHSPLPFSPPFPSLRRLHLVYASAEGLTLMSDFFRPTHPLAPFLTHLRISALWKELLPAAEFATALGIQSTPEPTTSPLPATVTRSPLRFPATLQYLLIEAMSAPPGGCPRPLQYVQPFRRGDMLSYEKLASDAQAPDRRVMFAESFVSTYESAFTVDEAKGLWVDRLSGGEGCWSVFSG